MFKAVLSEPNLLKESIRTIGELIREGVFEISKEGIRMVAMDPAVVTLVIFKLLPTAFSEYKVDKEVKIGVSIDALQTVLQRVGSTDRLTIEVPSKDMIKLTIEDHSTRRFRVPLLEITEEEPDIPDLKEQKATVEVKADIIYDGIKDAAIVSDVVNFSSDEEEFRIFTEEAAKKAELRLRKGSEGLIGLDVLEKARSKFSVDYLKSIIKARKIADTVVIRLGNDYPVRMDFRAIDKASLSFILAPRVSSK